VWLHQTNQKHTNVNSVTLIIDYRAKRSKLIFPVASSIFSTSLLLKLYVIQRENVILFLQANDIEKSITPNQPPWQ
jgi:hypothetical protein